MNISHIKHNPEGTENLTLNTVGAKKAVIETLAKEFSPEAARRLREVLQGLAESQEGRKTALNALFPEEQLEKMIEGGRRELEMACDSVSGYRNYMKRVHERLNRCAEIFGRESWGFANTADFEDRIDERNELQETGNRNKALNAALEKVTALYGTKEYGEPYVWVGDRKHSDKFLSEIREMVSEAYQN